MKEIAEKDAKSNALYNFESRDSDRRKLDAITATLKHTDIPEESLVAYNKLSLSTKAPGLTASKPYTNIGGQVDTVSNMLCYVSGSAIIHDIHFIEDTSAKSNNRDNLVLVETTGIVLFDRCIFTRSTQGVWINILAGGQIILTNCMFTGVTGGIFGCVVNAGAAADAIINGCANLTGQAHVAVTNLAEIT